MRIGIDIRPLAGRERTGIGEYAYGLLSALFRLFPEEDYLLFDSGMGDPAALPPLPKLGVARRVRVPNKLLHAAMLTAARPRLDRLLGPLDVFFSPNLGIAALSPRVPHILTIHDMSFAFFSDCFSFKQRLWHRAARPNLQARRAAAILVPSENTKRDVVSFYGVDEKKVHAVYPGISPAFSRRIQQPYHLPEKYILSVCAIEPRKNVDGLIEAFAHWKKRHRALASEFVLVLAGPKGYRGDAILRAARGREDIRYLGYVPAEEKPALFSGASLFVYPSFYEGFGFPILEAFAAGTPVVTSDRSSLPEVAAGAAYLVNPYNVADIAEGIARVLSDRALRDALTLRGRERAGAFSWDRTAAQCMELFYRVAYAHRH